MSDYQRVPLHEGDDNNNNSDDNDTVIQIYDDDETNRPMTLAEVDDRQNFHPQPLAPITPIITRKQGNSSNISDKSVNTATTEKSLSSPLTDSGGNLLLSLTLIRSGEANRRVLCSPVWTVSQLKNEVYPDEMKEGKNVRLIYLGRVLDNSQTLQSLEIEQDHVIHAMITEKISSPISSPNSTANNNNLTGNDFYQNRRAPDFIHIVNNNEDSDVEYDERYNNNNNSSGDQLSLTLLQPPEGTTRDFLFGFVLGLVLGFLSLLWLWNSAAPRKQRVGILLGLMCYVILTSFAGRESATPAP